MGDDSLILREDGYIHMNFPVTTLTYHSNLNIILVKTDVGGVHVLDVNSGVILQSSCLSADEGGALGVEYVPGADRVFVWDSSGVGARTDYNGVLLLHTALQRPLPSSHPDKIIRIELVLSEAVLLYQCLSSLDVHSIEGLSDFITELKNAIDAEPVRKGVKAQKWSTVTISVSQSTVRLVTTGVVQELKSQNRRIPALAIASAVGQRANELVPCSRDEESRPVMYSEAERKETFKRWPHMDYKWALPARMAQAGFYHQPSPSGDDRAMCFTCMVCLVCWEKSDEPWVEHERHSPNCPFVRGDYTHNVPISVTNATACAVPCPNVAVVSKGNTGDLIATGTVEGKVNIWKFDCGLKLVKYIHLSPYDSIFSGILATDSNKVWSTSLEKDSSTYGVELTAMAFVGMTSRTEPYPNSDGAEKETSNNKTKPSLICAVTITRTAAPNDQPIKEDSSKALFESDQAIQAMNDQNEAKSNLSPTNKMLFLLTYDIHSSLAGSITTVVHTSNSSGNSKPGGSKKVCTVPRTDDANIYDEIYFQFSDEDTELPLPTCTNSLLNEQISNVINLNASSSKEDCKNWEPKKIIYTKHFKVLPPPPMLPDLPESGQGSSILDFVGHISQLKSWKSGNLESVGTKLADQTDAVLQPADPITHYLNMNGPLEISDLKWYEGGDGTDKVKVTTFGGSKVGTTTAVSNSNNDGFDSDPPQEEAVSQGIAIQCLSLPATLNLREDSRVTHLLPVDDKEHLLVIISSIDPERVKRDDDDDKMDIDEVAESDRNVRADTKVFFLLFKLNSKTSVYTLEDNPVCYKELPFNESPVDVCLLPVDKHEQYSFASVGIDGSLRLYSLTDFKLLSEKRVPKGTFTSVAYCASVERLSVSTKHGMIYFYALNNGEKDSSGDVEEDELANIDLDMLQRAHEVLASPPVIIANKTELEMSDLETLASLTGTSTNTTVPYSAVVPGFWCELSPAQRSRSDHQNNRTWRLQNTSSTWDEHVLELTLPYSVSLAHIEFGFTLHSACTANLPIIQVTLLKQNLHGIGYKKDANFGHRSDSPTHFPLIDAEMAGNMENPVNSEEYLQAHNAEILAGPLLLSSGLDLTQQSGSLILTSPRIYRARGRTFLIHIKTLFDPAKDMSKSSSKSSDFGKKSGFIGCDWLHQISITVRSCPHSDVPVERQQRIAMLENNTFLNTLCEIAVSKDNLEKRKLALDLIMWVISIRLQRMRLSKTEKGPNPVETQQLECVKIIEKHTDALIKTCILCANRSVAKKCIKIILITRDGVKQLPIPWKSTFEQTLVNSVTACIPYVGACESAGALRWLIALTQHATGRYTAPVAKCLQLLETTAKTLRERSNIYHNLLKARFGLYGLPLERTMFAAEVPELCRGSSTPVTYASVLSGDTSVPAPAKHDYQLKDLLNLPPEYDTKSKAATTAWWAQNNGVAIFGSGLSEAMPLHVTCHVASDGTKLESTGSRHQPVVVSSLPGDPHQLWSVVKEGQSNKLSTDPDSLEDVESSLMDCDPQEKIEFNEEKFFTEAEQCGIPWGALVCRPPQHTLVVERMHSGARRYIVLDFGHTVRLSDLIIPSCSDLVTLCIDIWVTGEDVDCTKLAFATDIATKHLVLTDIQPPPLCRYMKITTIGRYGMTAMKCKIPLGWFYGEIAEIANVPASISALSALHEDLTCRFRLATGKLMDLLNPYLDLYNGNASHMMAYLNIANGSDPKVVTAYQECIELQQQLHTCTNVLRKLQNYPESNDAVLEMIEKQQVTPEQLLERASTDKLRVITENIVDMLLYFFFQVGDVQHEEVSLEWCETVCPLVWESSGARAAALGTLVARLCGGAEWWGGFLADTLSDAFRVVDAPPTALDRLLVLVMYMGRKTVFGWRSPEHGPAAALGARALRLLAAPRPHAALVPALLTALAAVLDAVPTHHHRHASRWEWVSGGRSGGADASPSSGECKLHRRKLHKKLLHQMQELEAARRGIQVAIDDQQRARSYLRPRMAMVKRNAMASGSREEESAPRTRPLPAPLAAALAHALVRHMLAMDQSHAGDTLLLAAKVVGRLCALSGGASLLEPASILGLAKLCVTLPPWPRHALTTLLQDLVEFESGESACSSNDDSWSESGSGSGSGSGSTSGNTALAGCSRVVYLTTEGDIFPLFGGKAPRSKHVTVAIPDTIDVVPKSIKMEELIQVAESDDSESEVQYVLKSSKKDQNRNKANLASTCSNISSCMDGRVECGPEAAGEAAARRVLVCGGGALAAGVRAPPPAPPPAPPQAPPPAPPAAHSAAAGPHHPPLTHTLYDVFRHLALDFEHQMDCTFMENVVSLWLTLNGCLWGGWTGTLHVPADAPRVRLASDTVIALLHKLTTLENVTLRCWVLSMQALAWIASLPLQTEGSTQTMGRVILECEHFVPAIVKFVTMNVNSDGSVTSSEPYLGGAHMGAGAGAMSALQCVVSRVVSARGAGGAGAALRLVAGAWRRVPAPPAALDLHATLLRLAAPMLTLLSPRHAAAYAPQLIHTIAENSMSWVVECGGGVGGASTCGGGGGGEARVAALLGEAGAAGRRAPHRPVVLQQLLLYCRKLCAVSVHQQTPSSPNTASGSEQSQTDESKAQQQEGTNIEDERKQQAARTPCVADSVLMNHAVMHKFYRTLSMCDGMNPILLNSGMNSDSSVEYATIKEELFWLVANLPTVASSPSLMVPSLMDYLRKDEIVNLSQGMQQLIIRLLDKPEALNAFIEAGGLELAVQKLTACHQSGPSNNQGLVSSLMNYLKLPPQLINLSSSKKTQPPVPETTTGLVNIAPLCTVSCCNPTAQAADVLLEGGGATGTACAARRVRAAAWSYHFFSADDASLALTVHLPYAAQLHEVQLQPHLTSLATCPGAVAIEAGCGGTLAPLGPPQNTAGMTFIRLAVTRPVVCTTVQIRLYKPRDSSNMGLLQLRLLAQPAFSPPNHHSSNAWWRVVGCMSGGGSVWAGAWARASAGAEGGRVLRALCAAAAAPPHAAAAAPALAAAARAAPHMQHTILTTLLDCDSYSHAQAVSESCSAWGSAGGARGAGGAGVAGGAGGAGGAVCGAVRALCVCCARGTLPAYLRWLAARDAARPPPAALVHTLANVLWTVKEERLMDNLEELITDELFELVYKWVNEVPESSLLKKAFDAVLCSLCYIRPELFKTLLEIMEIPIDPDESMEGVTDDRKVCGVWSGVLRLPRFPWSAGARRLVSVARAALSPAATLRLLHSQLPLQVLHALTDYSEAKLAQIKRKREPQEDVQMSEGDKESDPNSNNTVTELPPMSSVCQLVDWIQILCADRKLKDWLGGPGAFFWSPLLTLLCCPREPESSWQEGAEYAQLEESTIRLFAELTVCHPANQKLFATTLHSILESLHSTGTEGISGFSRALILRLVVSGEWCRVGVSWRCGEAGGVAGGAGPAAAPAHPAHHYHALLTLPLSTTIRQLVTDLPLIDNTTKVCVNNSSSGAATILRSASDTAIMTVAEALELSLAAASASKDKREKDVKNTSLKQQNNKKRQSKVLGSLLNEPSVLSINDELVESMIRVRMRGVEGWIGGGVTLAQLCAAAPHVFGPHLSLELHLSTGDAWSGSTWEPPTPARTDKTSLVLRQFGECGGLALVAARLPRPAPAPAPPPPPRLPHDLDWVKLDDPYEEVVEAGSTGAGAGVGAGAGTWLGVPGHALVALGVLLKLPGYAAALLEQGERALRLLRLLLGVTHDDQGRSIVVSGSGNGGWSLGTLPFLVVGEVLEREDAAAGAGAGAGGAAAGGGVRGALLRAGCVRLLLACLAVFTHHRPQNSQSSNGSSAKGEEKSQLYWAKGTGFGTGSTQQSWNVEQALVRQRTEEEHVTVLLQVLASYMNPGEKWPPEESTEATTEEPPSETEEDNNDVLEERGIPPEFIDLIANSSLVPAICSYLRNDSVLDMSRHIPLYVCVLRVVRALWSLRAARLATALTGLPALLRQMATTTAEYGTKLRMSKKNIFGKMTYSQRFSTSSNSELSEEDEGLAALIADIQATAALMCRNDGDSDANGNLPRTLSGASREARYIELMRTMQFESFEMIVECPEFGFKFTVPYHFEASVRSGSGAPHPARMKRLAQEAATLATSLPLSYCSSVFVRTDTDRLDVMKVLITGPSDTPYANGCFVLDVYFPAEYPAVPMLINLETTGRHSVRFNPNLYNDGKVCLSVLNTWHGRPEEKWNAHTSSFLQVLVSIQSLILVPEPYFNEPGYERSRGTRVGNSASLEYNSNIYQAAVRWAMLDHLRNPEPCFKQVIQTHFWIKRNEIMQTVANWISELEGQSGDERTQRSIQLNLMALKRHYIKLEEELAKLPVPPGLEDLDEPFIGRSGAGAGPAQPAAEPTQPATEPAAPGAGPGSAGAGPASAGAGPDLDHDMEKIVAQVLD